ncbi:hypothetical protein A2291_05180 [candidate division WOR-1 bacterium RIFOXYB2_FULL_42_35]|uniref:NodB homology domain-containing protein n=1 Tax=candidate division WOR-1 bacterium RIFOXYC2_FULL_41_25 TaxID=1802586 RepID=A0A1F4TNJ8_UNCSA|nr:MAG: hypothetical protein A2247_00600 [candidate division WOR-1 bacterium RIFOXYA2_FULL_41_14]OGC24493.1 MAG: hypothetical protein A2291_05180 [candidate division WOR-1 bacterium RIFOXYB2_FULL_42_35]OGC34110.1 MAG: hypothetical protein A2462_01040 [candidate division WOR-1 bacterium RIFOXYC2_FULL_41_25]OGC42805.1 MAG: hypothetical protein A2548_00660 [candidate division WOR-1 bacterium RIFOXYD2_FULL_41_8]
MIKLTFILLSLFLFFNNPVFGAVIPQNIILTIDLCPSSHSYEKTLFQTLENFSQQQGRATPVVICVSGRWLDHHQKELTEIKKLKLDITWANHSYEHPIDHGFCTNPKFDFVGDLKKNEATMIKYGLKPSKYYRFPGLVANKTRLKQLSDLGYTVLGADVWLGKGQKIKDGAIVLIHGNGNELPGIVEKFMALLKSNQVKIISL